MSYLKVTLGGKERGVKFNQMALEVYAKHLDENAINTSAVYATLYAGLIANCYVKREEPDFTFEEVTNWTEDLAETDPESVKSVCSFFEKTDSYKKWLSAFQERVRSLLAELDEDKKKESLEVEAK